MKEETKEKNDTLITIILLIIAGVLLSSVLIRMEKALEWVSNNFNKFFEPYQSMGIWFYVIIFSMIAIYVYLMFGGKKVEEDEEKTFKPR